MIGALPWEPVQCMSKNELIALNSHYANWLTSRGAGFNTGNVNPFVYYAFEQFLKPFDLSDEEIALGITEGQLDGGIDGLYFLIDRELVRDDSELDSKTTQTVDVVLLQVKSTEGGFSPPEVDKAYFFIDDLFDLSRTTASLNNKYNAAVTRLMELFREKYQVVVSAFPKVKVQLHYITKGDEETPNQSAKQSAERVKRKVLEHLHKADCTYQFHNAQSLLEQIQERPPSSRTLVWADSPAQTDEGYVGLVALTDYFSFITDGKELARRIFESNVRGWQGGTAVNRQIRKSLQTHSDINFWLLNNGITILTSATGPAGGAKRVALRDARVVNGLQTSRAIYDFFRVDKPQNEKRKILVRVIETADQAVFDEVVKATNSQNKMPAASLRATDEIHRHIEELFKQYDLFYDRRKGVYKDEGKPVAKIVSVGEVLQAVVAIMLQKPDDARARPGTYLSKDEKYEEVFGAERYDLNVYLKCINIIRRVDAYLAMQDELTRGDRTNIRFYVASLLVCDVTNQLPPSQTRTLAIDIGEIDEQLQWAYETVWRKFKKLSEDEDSADKVAKGPELLKQIHKVVKGKLTRQSKH